MATRTMRRNLPPNAEPWGREVDNRLTRIETDVTRALQDNTNALKGVNSAINQLSKQVAALDSLTQELQVVVNELPYPTSATASTSNFQAGLGEQARVTATIPVPAGKTAATFFAFVQGWYFSDFDVPLSDLAAFRIGSGGWRSGWAVMVSNGMDSYQVLGSASNRVDVTSEDALSVTCYSSAGPALAPALAENSLTLNVLAIFS